MSASFYREMLHAIILYGSETWALLASTTKRIEGKHTEFLQMITRKTARQLGYGTWKTLGAEGVREAAGNQSAMIYIETPIAPRLPVVALCRS